MTKSVARLCKALAALVFALSAFFIFEGCGDNEKLNFYSLNVTYDDESRTLSGKMDFEYYNGTDNAIDALCFNLYGNAYRENAKYKSVGELHAGAYYDGESYGGMTVNGVTGGDAEVVGADQNILRVKLNSELYPCESAKISVDYSLVLAKVNHRTGVTANCVNLGNFYPTLCAYKDGFVECLYYSTGDPFYSECANYEVRLTVDEGYMLACSGEVTSVERQGASCVYSSSLKNARDYAMVLSRGFTVAETEVLGTLVKYYYYNDDMPVDSLKAACESFAYFSKKFGAYPYKTLSVVQTGFCHGGMEYPALTYVSDELEGRDALYAIVHENAHQWWCVGVGNDQINEAWLDEGLSEFSTADFFAAHESYNQIELMNEMKNGYKRYFNVYSQLYGKADTSMTRATYEFKSEYEYACIAYYKSAIMFDRLRVGIGDKKFYGALKSFYAKYCGKLATGADLIACFEKQGADAEGYFYSFLSGKVII